MYEYGELRRLVAQTAFRFRTLVLCSLLKRNENIPFAKAEVSKGLLEVVREGSTLGETVRLSANSW